MSSKKKSPKARVRQCLHSLGLPIVQGSSSTILGIIALLLAQSYIFLVFFKMVFLVMFFGAMHGLFLLPVLLSLFGPGSLQTWKGTDLGEEHDIDDDFSKLSPSMVDKSYVNALSMQPSNKIILNGQFSTKGFLGAPYKAYGEEKDLGIGTSGEDSSESSSNRSQRRQANEDEQTRRRYEDGWRRSLYHNYYINNQSQFQAQPELYGEPVNAREWQERLADHTSKQKNVYNTYNANAILNLPVRQLSQDVIDAPEKFSSISSTSDHSRRKYRKKTTNIPNIRNDQHHFIAERAIMNNTGKKYHARRSSDDLMHHFQRWNKPQIDEIYTTGDRLVLPQQRSHSHHNLFYLPAPVASPHPHQPPTYQFGDFF